MFGDFHQAPEEVEAADERMAQLRALLGEQPEAATKTRRTDDRRDQSGRRKKKPHAPGQPVAEPSRKRDGRGYKVLKENDPRRWRRA